MSVVEISAASLASSPPRLKSMLPYRTIDSHSIKWTDVVETSHILLEVHRSADVEVQELRAVGCRKIVIRHLIFFFR